MTHDLSPEAWAQIRFDYEHSATPVEDICFAHGISSGTLRDRMRRWSWTRRRAPIPHEGPPRLPAPTLPSPGERAFTPVFDGPSGGGIREVSSERAFTPVFDGLCGGGIKKESAQVPAVRHDDSPHPAASHPLGSDPPPPGEGDAPGAIVPRLQSAVARVLPAIEATLAKLTAGPAHPREMEQAARALSSLTRTLRELHGLLAQQPAPAADDSDMPEDIDEFRFELARRMRQFREQHAGKTADGAAEQT